MSFYKQKDYFGVTLIVLIERRALKDILVGLNDKDNNTLNIGTIIDLDPFAGKLTLFTPVHDIHRVTTIRLGAVKLERGEREYGKARVIQYL